MFKKIMLPIMIISIIIQLLVPVGMICFGKNIDANLQNNGTEYKFEIRRIDIVGGTCSFSLIDGYFNYYHFNNYYGIVEEYSSTGFAYLYDYVKTKPDTSNYIRFTENNYDKMTHFETGIDATFLSIEKEAYAIIKVYNGEIVVTDVYIDNMPVAQWIEMNKD